VFLKPTVIRTSMSGPEITSERYDYLRGEQLIDRPEARPFWPDTTSPKWPRRRRFPARPERRSPCRVPFRCRRHGPGCSRRRARPRRASAIASHASSFDR
jgi:hypothetical protein